MSNTFDKKTVLTAIEDRIAPFIGQTMARASTKVQCQKLGITEAKITMTGEEVESLLDKIGKAMMVFVGREKTDQIITDIHQSIGMGG